MSTIKSFHIFILATNYEKVRKSSHSSSQVTRGKKNQPCGKHKLSIRLPVIIIQTDFKGHRVQPATLKFQRFQRGSFFFISHTISTQPWISYTAIQRLLLFHCIISMQCTYLYLVDDFVLALMTK